MTITARVDGELQKVGFVEGQKVNKGDLIGQIDPRPFKAALDQAVAMHAKDIAQLASAKADSTVMRCWPAEPRQQADTRRATRTRRAVTGADPGRPGEHR